jgi:phosphoribosylamine--glycine ligase
MNIKDRGESKVKILVVGGGGREHALVWKISQSPLVDKIYCAPGNAGISRLAECVEIDPEDIQSLVNFAEKESIDLTVVGPEAPLVMGIVDEFEDRGLKIFGPREKAAQIEGSKVFAKRLMEKYDIPTASYRVFDDAAAAKDYLKDFAGPVVVKAEGLAAGKGVVVARNGREAEEAVDKIMVDRAFGEAGNRVVIEEYLEGREVSILAFTDGNTVIPMVSAQDHKRVFDNDEGPNTGGMGAFSPSPVYTQELGELVERAILKKAVEALNKKGIKYKGVLYAGLMITERGPKVLEFNARFGDPETQVVLPRLKTDLVKVMLDVVEEKLEKTKLEWSSEAAVCVIIASGGYPIKYEKGWVISGLDEAEKIDNVMVFHAGTRLKQGKTVTDGGRVLGVTALGNDVRSAAQKAYMGVEKLNFKFMHYRKDIGK